MEQLLFLLFILFSIVSWFLERRKKAKQLEEQRQRREQQQREPSPARTTVEDEDEEVAWPFGGDLFEEEQPQDSMAEAAEAQTLASEREALVAERRALEVERMALEVARQASGQQSGQRMTDLLRQRAAQQETRPSQPLQIGKWTIDPKKARDAIVYAEILGKPKAERREDD